MTWTMGPEPVCTDSRGHNHELLHRIDPDAVVLGCDRCGISLISINYKDVAWRQIT